jgi:hypothetical protein
MRTHIQQYEDIYIEAHLEEEEEVVQRDRGLNDINFRVLRRRRAPATARGTGSRGLAEAAYGASVVVLPQRRWLTHIYEVEHTLIAGLAR